MEVIIVDDNSPDGTQERVKDLQKIYGSDKVVLAARAGKLGLGSAYIHGLERCRYDYVVLMDADLSHHVSLLLTIAFRLAFFDKSPFLIPVYFCFSQNSSPLTSTKCKRPELILLLVRVICQEVAFTAGTSIVK